jgi:hypothetical protein
MDRPPQATALAIIPNEVRSACVRVLVLSCGAYAVLSIAGFHGLFAGDAEGIAAILAIIGTLFSVLYAFATYVIWGQFTAVESQIQQEAGALKDLVSFSHELPENVRDPIVRSVKNYARAVIESEWRALSRGESTEKTDRAFPEIISSVTALNPEDGRQRALYSRLLELANDASTHRHERLALSAKRIPRTLLLFVNITALSIVLLVFLLPFRNPFLGGFTLALTILLLYFARFVLTDLDNPFEGTWNVSAEPFVQLLSKLR